MYRQQPVGDEVDGQEQQEAGEGQAVLLLSHELQLDLFLPLSLLSFLARPPPGDCDGGLEDVECEVSEAGQQGTCSTCQRLLAVQCSELN